MTVAQAGGRLWGVLPVVYKPSSEQESPRRGTLKLAWKAAAKTAKPLRRFSIKPDTSIMGIIEGYHTNLSSGDREGG